MCYYIYKDKLSHRISLVILKSLVVQHYSGMVSPSQPPEVTTFPAPQFYFKATSFMDAVSEMLAFFKKVYIVAKASEKIYMKINPMIKY